VNWGLLTDDRGCPVAVSVFEGNTGDAKTLLPQVEKVRAAFGIDRLIMAGERRLAARPVRRE
jgi:transposase